MAKKVVMITRYKQHRFSGLLQRLGDIYAMLLCTHTWIQPGLWMTNHTRTGALLD